jgi:hypothetical protein
MLIHTGPFSHYLPGPFSLGLYDTAQSYTQKQLDEDLGPAQLPVV